MEAVHYTSIRKWFQIRLAGRLKPMTRFLFDDSEKRMVSSRQDLLAIADKKFTVAIPRERVRDWKNHGLYDKLRKTTGSMQLTFPIEASNGVMVRDIYFTTADNSRRVFRYDIYSLFYGRAYFGMVGKALETQLEQLYTQYLESSRPLAEADLQGVKVPEIWIPAEVPIANIEGDFWNNS